MNKAQEDGIRVINKKTEEAGGTSNLMCYARGLEGIGECRIMLTSGDNRIFKGDPKPFGAVGVKSLYIKSISINHFVMCYDALGHMNNMPLAVNHATCMVITIDFSKNDLPTDMEEEAKAKGYAMFHFPGFNFSDKKVEFVQDFQKMLSVTVTRAPIYQEKLGKPLPALLSICYFTKAYGSDDDEDKTAELKSSEDSNKIKKMYHCEMASVDDRDSNSLKLLGEVKGRSVM